MIAVTDPGPVCGRSGCPRPVALMWQRYATDAERAAVEPPPVQGDVVLVPVFACTQDTLQQPLPTGTHQSTCTAPTGDLTCNCTPDYPQPGPAVVR